MTEIVRPRVEPSGDLDALARRVIGAAIEVHRELGPGFVESVYEEALAIELELRAIRFERQVPIAAMYKDRRVGEAMLVEGQLVLELKAISELAPIHTAQLMSYLKATRYQLGLLINFNTPVLKSGLKRLVYTPPTRR
ncbi:MAG: GxxExxY protein [Dehalococcoidia bacterium]